MRSGSRSLNCLSFAITVFFSAFTPLDFRSDLLAHILTP